ncbi:M20 family metallopeptidase [Stigmatella aurantiaca]|uniref:Peptidase, M20 (Glutamate carboxypeptidase) family n=1 Tax=Stigmatella aurantiaca (strain DW4/3-1) TaxID=378806 RepID=Q08SD4_STIAD|nr:M20 family metallopeptidase [Stigmatella aurantiaca]ADO70705.1 Peptidase, M20 (Glutamate carboxypeptidase) family [Stigmatella aurantiaca DW4/3-1]EAU63388.1 succinyl-diaminopimelate desuccinylase [Stigmatella aurantiaca DW4/3-1]
MNHAAALQLSDSIWEKEILPQLERYIRIPNKSPAFEPSWVNAGHMEAAVKLIAAWAETQAAHIPGLKVEVVRLKNEKGEPRTPVIFMEIPGDGKDTVLLYGHLDKQPEMTGWREGLEPWKPVREGDKLYGRGGADDGYSSFASLAAIRLLREQKLPHARCVVLIEACEESGSYDLPAYIEALAPRIGQPSLVVCLDSGCANYEQLWMTTSLRGLIAGNLRVDILTEGVHSGDASGVVPSSFRILRQLLDRVDDVATGRVRIEGLHVQIPQGRQEQARAVAHVLGEEVFSRFPWVEGSRPVTNDHTELILNRTWRPALSVTGVEGMPPLGSAGNVLRPFTSVKLSVRIPPRLDAVAATKTLKEILESNPPYGARVTFEGEKASAGWDAPALAPWLEKATAEASLAFFGKPFMAMGEGGTIPFMEMLGKRFPEAQFLITGVLGPNSNAHGPNEFLHIPTGKKLTACVASVVATHFKR